MNNVFLFLLALTFSQTLFAKDIKIGSYPREIAPYIREAEVWQRPSWINENLQFVKSPDLINGPKATGYAKLLSGKAAEEVWCKATPADLTRESGKSTKFYCGLLEPTKTGFTPVTKKDGERRVIKVKYSLLEDPNNEVYGEVLGTRLLWALGFGADQIFHINKIYCIGCSLHPHKDRRLHPDQASGFDGVIVEKKFDADELLSYDARKNGSNGVEWTSGIRFKELMEYLPVSSQKARQEQIAHRDALRLLAAFMQHVDLKGDNQRFVCLKTNSRGQCLKPFAMIHDIGSSFGSQIKNFKLDKVNLEAWRNTPIWRNPKTCEALMGKGPLVNIAVSTRDPSMASPQISEAGRQFLSKLLVSFAADKNRVRDLFRAAHINERGSGDTIEKWVDAFYYRVSQIAYPSGRRDGFRCPKTNYEY